MEENPLKADQVSFRIFSEFTIFSNTPYSMLRWMIILAREVHVTLPFFPSFKIGVNSLKSTVDSFSFFLTDKPD